MRVALLHYWLVSMRGGEHVLRALCDMFPEAEIFTHVSSPELVKAHFAGHQVHHTFISRLPFARKLYQKYLPLMPLALEHLDLRGFDLVISSESGPAKGIIPPVDAPHLCYCHSPMRYAWDQYHHYRDHAGAVTKFGMIPLIHAMRQWDVSTAARVDQFVANSTHVAKRINKYYRRDSLVIHPPVRTELFVPRGGAPEPDLADAYLWVGQLVRYKRPDIAVDAFTRMKRRLIVIGEGEEKAKLMQRAGETVKFLGRADFETLLKAYQSCRALVFPGEEDFGIVPVEAMAAGLPVIAFGRGGVLDSVIDGQTGLLYPKGEVEDLIAAVERFEQRHERFDPAALRAQAERFSPQHFTRDMTGALRTLGYAGAIENSPDA